jgi:hypothetical protein
VNGADLVAANAARGTQALRSLQECAAIVAPASVPGFERIRYRLYDLERGLLAVLRARDLLADISLCVLIDGRDGPAAFARMMESLVEAGVRMLLDSVVGRTALERTTAQQHQTFFLASTPRPHNDVLTLAPIKFDWRSFAQFSTTHLWAEQDRRLAKEYSINYVPYYEASSAFRGLQCDGLHFGNSWEEVAGCKGFTVVTDLIINHALGKICSPDGPSVHIGEVRTDCSWQSD